jgi:hypothetical protein
MMPAPTATAIFAAILLCAAALLATGDTAKAANNIVAKAADDAAKGAVADDLVVEACFNVTNRYKKYGPGLTRSSCEMALWSDKRSASAKEPRDLALLAMALVQEAAAVADAKVAALSSSHVAKLSKGASPQLSLRYCRLDYEAVAHTVPVCREMVQEYDTSVDPGDSTNMIAYDYFECANKVIKAARGCWERITFDYETRKAMWKEVEEVASRANLAKAMVENMIGVVDDFFANDDSIDDDDDEEDNNDHHRHGHHHHYGGGLDPDDDDDDNDHHRHGHHHHYGGGLDADDDDDDDHHRHGHRHSHDDDDD